MFCDSQDGPNRKYLHKLNRVKVVRCLHINCFPIARTLIVRDLLTRIAILISDVDLELVRLILSSILANNLQQPHRQCSGRPGHRISLVLDLCEIDTGHILHFRVKGLQNSDTTGPVAGPVKAQCPVLLILQLAEFASDNLLNHLRLICGRSAGKDRSDGRISRAGGGRNNLHQHRKGINSWSHLSQPMISWYCQLYEGWALPRRDRFTHSIVSGWFKVFISRGERLACTELKRVQAT